MQLLLYMLSGLLGVSNIILWGIYGDLQMESFDIRKVYRSIAFGLIYAAFLYLVNPALPLVIVLLCTVTFERITTEIYKAFIRHESQDKYTIPSNLNLKIPEKLKPWLGYFMIIAVVLIFYRFNFEFNRIIVVLIAGFAPALGGMLKDAPYEGFQPLKFFRSPIVSLIIGMILLRFFPSVELRFFLFAIWGGERIVSECYKKIIKGNAPGKFKVDSAHQVSISWKKKRQRLLPLYWITVLMILLLGYLFCGH